MRVEKFSMTLSVLFLFLICFMPISYAKAVKYEDVIKIFQESIPENIILGRYSDSRCSLFDDVLTNWTSILEISCDTGSDDDMQGAEFFPTPCQGHDFEVDKAKIIRFIISRIDENSQYSFRFFESSIIARSADYYELFYNLQIMRYAYLTLVQECM